jgi:hypothetical protein
VTGASVTVIFYDGSNTSGPRSRTFTISAGQTLLIEKRMRNGCHVVISGGTFQLTYLPEQI